MKLDSDIIYALLRSFGEDDSSRLAQFKPEHVDAQRELLLEAGFAEGYVGGRVQENHRPIVWNYSQTSLTDSGRLLLQLSTDPKAWKQAKEAYEEMGQTWSLDDLINYLEKHAR